MALGSLEMPETIEPQRGCGSPGSRSIYIRGPQKAGALLSFSLLFSLSTTWQARDVFQPCLCCNYACSLPPEHRDAQVLSSRWVATAAPREHEAPTLPTRKEVGLLPLPSSHWLHEIHSPSCTSPIAVGVTAGAAPDRPPLPSHSLKHLSFVL